MTAYMQLFLEFFSFFSDKNAFYSTFYVQKRNEFTEGRSLILRQNLKEFSKQQQKQR